MKETNNKTRILIGTWAWGAGYNGSSMVFGKKQDENVLRDTFDLAVKEGFLKWDTAAVYGMGSAEKLLGKFMKGRDDTYISTKFFPSKKHIATYLGITPESLSRIRSVMKEENG